MKEGEILRQKNYNSFIEQDEEKKAVFMSAFLCSIYRAVSDFLVKTC